MKSDARSLTDRIAIIAAKARRARDLMPALRAGAQVVALLIDDSFRGQRSPDGSPWVPDKPSTIARKGSRKANIDTGRMRASVSARAEAPNAIVFGTNAKYAAFAQFGAKQAGRLKRAAYKPPPKREAGTAWKRRSPARPFLPAAPGGGWPNRGPAARALEKIKTLVLDWIRNGKLAS